MKRFVLTTAILFSFALTFAQKSADTDFDTYLVMAMQAKEHRTDRLVNFDEFLRMSKETNTVILDSRSDKKFESKHLKGAVHLDFTDFDEGSLRKKLGEFGAKDSVRILIYCNNNFDDDRENFVAKTARSYEEKLPLNKRSISLALNISTYIQLYAYGYQNVYELSERLSVYDKRAEFEGTSVLGVAKEKKEQAVEQKAERQQAEQR